MNEKIEHVAVNINTIHHQTPPRSPKSALTGTGEWACTTVNILKGCSHNCRYCYARCDAVRFGRISRPEHWCKEELKPTLPKIRKFPGRVMFPSTHDITPEFLDDCVRFLRGLLEAGNEVLIVSKPHYYCIERLCRELRSYKPQIVFRFSIGSKCNDCTRFWEPGAPTATERIACLQYAYAQGFTTSVSQEPMLSGIEDAIATFHALKPFVREKIWIGRMNQVNRRVDRSQSGLKIVCQRLQELQCDAEILKMVGILGSEPKVEWKDSIKKVIDGARAALSEFDTFRSALQN